MDNFTEEQGRQLGEIGWEHAEAEIESGGPILRSAAKISSTCFIFVLVWFVVFAGMLMAGSL